VAYNHLPDRFPLTKFPVDVLRSGLFLSAQQRW
jgi:hypothetical protein